MRYLKIFILILFFSACLWMGGLSLFAKYEGPLFSENRATVEKPLLTKEALGSGDYFNQVNDYLQDVHPLRQDLIEAKAVFQGKAVRKPVVNNVYWKGKVNLPYVDGMDTDSLKAEISAKEMADFYEKLSRDCQDQGTHFVFVGIPNQTDIFSKDFPAYMEDTSYLRKKEEDLKEELGARGVDSLFLRDVLEKDPGAYYLKTDHHCSKEGLLLESQEILKKLQSPYGQEMEKDFIEKVDLRPFVGSRSRKIPGLAQEEKFSYFVYKEPFSYQLTLGQGQRGELLALNPQAPTISYEAYMGGDQAYSKLTTDRKAGLKILLYGDSYTNGIETLLAPYVQKMTSFDFRYGDNKKEFFRELRTGDYDYCLCIRDSGNYLKNSSNGCFYK